MTWTWTWTWTWAALDKLSLAALTVQFLARRGSNEMETYEYVLHVSFEAGLVYPILDKVETGLDYCT